MAHSTLVDLESEFEDIMLKMMEPRGSRYDISYAKDLHPSQYLVKVFNFFERILVLFFYWISLFINLKKKKKKIVIVTLTWVKSSYI